MNLFSAPHPNYPWEQSKRAMHRYAETIELLHREPTKWLARKTVPHIRMFLSAFYEVEVIGTGRSTAFIPLMNGFSQFLAAKYSGIYLDYDEDVALSEAAYDDDGSFELYFTEWRAFFAEWIQTSHLTDLGNESVPVIDLSTRITFIRT